MYACLNEVFIKKAIGWNKNRMAFFWISSKCQSTEHCYFQHNCLHCYVWEFWDRFSKFSNESLLRKIPNIDMWPMSTWSNQCICGICLCTNKLSLPKVPVKYINLLKHEFYLFLFFFFFNFRCKLLILLWTFKRGNWSGRSWSNWCFQSGYQNKC